MLSHSLSEIASNVFVSFISMPPSPLSREMPLHINIELYQPQDTMPCLGLWRDCINVFLIPPFHLSSSCFQSEASPLHLLAYWPRRHRKHPLHAQEEVSVIVCLFGVLFERTPKTQLKGLQFAGYT